MLTTLLVASLLAQPNPPIVPYGQEVVSRSSAQTTSNVTYYVETTGSDTNDCLSVQTACLTFQGAFNKIPPTVKHLVTVTGGLGSLNGGMLQGKQIINATNSTQAGIRVQGTLVTATVATGSATGTATSASAASGATRPTMTDSTQSWTANDLKGKLICATSGSGNGACGVILSNTATVITHLHLAGATSWNSAFTFSAGNTYVIRDWGTTLSAPTFQIPPSLLGSAASTSAAHFYPLDNAGGGLPSILTTTQGAGLIEFRGLKFTANVSFRPQGNTAPMGFYWNSYTGSSSGPIPSRNFGSVFTMASYFNTTGTAVGPSAGGDAGPVLVKYAFADACGAFISATIGGAFGLGGIDHNQIECTSGLQLGYGVKLNQGGTGNVIDCESRSNSVGVAVFGSGSDYTNIANVDIQAISISNCTTAVRVWGQGSVLALGTLSGSGNTTCVEIRNGGQVQVDVNSLSGCTTEINLDNSASTWAFSQATAGASGGVRSLTTGSAYYDKDVSTAGPMVVGLALVPKKTSSVPTCAAGLLGGQVNVNGGASEGANKICYCTSDGAATPAYQWCSLGLQSGTYTCVGGTATACP